MSTLLRIPEPAADPAIAAGIPDAQLCARWAGPWVPFPFYSLPLRCPTCSALGFNPVEPASIEEVLFVRAEVQPSMERAHHGAAPGRDPSGAVPPWGVASFHG